MSLEVNTPIEEGDLISFSMKPTVYTLQCKTSPFIGKTPAELNSPKGTGFFQTVHDVIRINKCANCERW